jgi:large subunit ribosomal protein L25
MIIPVKFTGSSNGVLNGGVLRKNNRKLRIKALPDNLPEFVEADITELKIGSKLYVTALEGEGYKFMHPDNTVVCHVRTSLNAVVDEEEEDGEEGEATEAPAEAAAE